MIVESFPWFKKKILVNKKKKKSKTHSIQLSGKKNTTPQQVDISHHNVEITWICVACNSTRSSVFIDDVTGDRWMNSEVNRVTLSAYTRPTAARMHGWCLTVQTDRLWRLLRGFWRSEFLPRLSELPHLNPTQNEFHLLMRNSRQKYPQQELQYRPGKAPQKRKPWLLTSDISAKHSSQSIKH